MSHNTRRGNLAYNKNVSASSVGQRRPIVTNNYVQQFPPQNTGSPQQNQGYMNQQHPQRQSQRQQGYQQNAQQQLAKQQQMLAQKKQQLAQQQQQQKQRQQRMNQTPQKQEQLSQQQKELELEKQNEMEQMKQKEMQLQKQKDLELQKQKALELQKQKELELQKQKELELQKQKELELQKQKELEQKQKEAEQQRQKELELQRQREQDQLKQKELEQKNKQHQAAQPQQTTQQQTQNKSVTQNGGPVTEQSVEGDQTLDTEMSFSGQENVENGKERRSPRKWRPRIKLSKYEILRRRNFKLSKLLQPKNAMMILNEVVKNITYSIDSFPTVQGTMFKAVAVIEGVTHEGIGANKNAAKNNAAERALQYMVKNKKLLQVQPPPPYNVKGEGVEPMDTSESVDENESPFAWQHFASFAVYKLLDTWGEDPQAMKDEARPMKKPAKKMPANANLMNPLMLLNQMMPHLQFEEMPRTTHGPFYTFNYKCTIDGQTFLGSGTSKKVAKRAAAFEICRKILQLEYPPEIYTPPAPVTASVQHQEISN